MRRFQVTVLLCVLRASQLIGSNKVKRDEGWKGFILPQETFSPLKLFEVYIGNRSAFTPTISALDFAHSLNDPYSDSNSPTEAAWTPSQGPLLTELELLEPTSKRLRDTKSSLVTILKPPIIQSLPKISDWDTLPSFSNPLMTGNAFNIKIPAVGNIGSGILPIEDQDDLVMTLYPHPSSVKRIPVMPGDPRSRIPPQVLTSVNSSVSVVHSMQVFAPKQGYFPAMAAKHLELHTEDQGEATSQKTPLVSFNHHSLDQFHLETPPVHQLHSNISPVHKLHSKQTPLRQLDLNTPPVEQHDVNPPQVNQLNLMKVELVPFTAEDVIYDHNFRHVAATTEVYEDQVAQGSEQRITQEPDFKPLKISNAHQGPVPAFWAYILEKMNQTLENKDIVSSAYTIEDLVTANEDDFTVEVHGALALPLQGLQNHSEEDWDKSSQEDETQLFISTPEMNSLGKKDILTQLGERDAEVLKAEPLEDQGKLEEFMLSENEDWTSDVNVSGIATGGSNLRKQTDSNFTRGMGTSHDKNFDTEVVSNFTPESTVSREVENQTLEPNNELLENGRFTTELLPTTFLGSTDFLLTTTDSRESRTTSSPTPISETFPTEFSKTRQNVHIIVADLGDSVKPKSKRLKNAVLKSNKMSPKGAVFTVVEGHSKVRFFGYNTLYEGSQAQYYVNKDNSIYMFPTKDTVQTLHQQQSDQTTGIRPVYFAKRPLTSLSGPYEYDQHLKRLSSNRLPPLTNVTALNRTSTNVSNTYQRIKQIRPFFNTKYVRSRIPWRNQ